MILIYVPEITPRIKYIFTFIFEHILENPIQITDNPHFFITQTSTKFSYCQHPLADEIHFHCMHLLFENGIREQNTEKLLKDPFAWSFYLLSRYEEYLPYEKDSHNRFSYQSSNAKNNTDILSPWIDLFAYELAEDLKISANMNDHVNRKFEFCNTIDLDHPWKYKHHSIIRISGSIAKKLVRGNFKILKDQLRVLLNLKNDPYFIYKKISGLNIPTTYFIPFGGNGKYDTNHSPNNYHYKQLILKLNNKPNTYLGIHPSYFSNSNAKTLENEKLGLEHLINQPILRSRQHYIMLQIPQTYHNLLTSGIKEDFTMGYQDHAGFRAGTCTPFYWFDLTKNKVTELKVYPFCIMDVTLKNYMNLSVKESKVLIDELIKSVRSVNGHFISIFHNDSISGYGEWKDWETLYDYLIEKCKND
ncbi:polysaccharide deacetylase family protein [Apibacter raozihei]|uniref:polysaccharide deacetylase family protein n=1 Tax=Apibacter raozihei TaxID=2500547 RepID=UPI000FE29FB7|nr:polysaccharide deacetylase family protein [Apibacter raozihei]